MKVILLKKIATLGDMGTVVKVAPGYARNKLLPQREAMAATPENLKLFEEKIADLKKTAAQEKAEAEARQKKLIALKEPITIRARATKEGKLFGSVNASEIVKALGAHHIAIQKREVVFLTPSGAIRELGEHSVEICLHPDVKADIPILVISDA